MERRSQVTTPRTTFAERDAYRRNPVNSSAATRSDNVSQNRRSTSRNAPNSANNDTFKFLPGNSTQVRIRKNYMTIETAQPTTNFVYFARSLTPGRAFCVSVAEVLCARNSDFSFVLGFSTCSPAAILDDLNHQTRQCSPIGCGGNSQQVKIFNASEIGSKITIERQPNGDVCFAIDSSMPIRIQFDRDSCAVDLVREQFLTPYIQLSGIVLALSIQTNSIRKLNVESAIAVRRAPLGTATALGPPLQKRSTRSKALSAIVTGQSHQAFTAETDVDIKFVDSNYPGNDVKVSTNRMAILRKNELGERFVFYVEKLFNLNAQVTVQVTKIYRNPKYSSDFEFGLATDRMETNESEFLVDCESLRATSHCLKVDEDAKVNDKFTFTLIGQGVLEIRKNDIVRKISKMNRTFAETENLLPFIVLNGTVSGIISANATSMEFGQTYQWPPVEFKATTNVELTSQTLLRWRHDSGKAGVIVNAKPFENVLKFIIRDVRTSIEDHSMTFGLINSTSIGFRTPREMSTCLDFKHENLIRSPAIGLKFSLYKTPYGKVTLKCENGDPVIVLFMVDPKQCFCPVIILNGYIVAIELLPNASKTTVNVTKGVKTSSPESLVPSPQNDCKICMDRPINSVFVPCGHRFACYDCGKEWMRNGNHELYGNSSNCPVCRKSVDTLLQTFD